MKNIWIWFFFLSPTLAFADYCPFNEIVGTYLVTNVTCTGLKCPSPQELDKDLNSKLEVFKEPNTDGPNVYGQNPRNYAEWRGVAYSEYFALDEKDQLLTSSNRLSPYANVEQFCVQKNHGNITYRIFSTRQDVNEPGINGTRHLFSNTQTFTQNVTQGAYQLIQTSKDNVLNYDLSVVYSLERLYL